MDLENCLDELNDAAGDRDISLRPTSGHQDLTSLGDSDWSEQQEGGADEYISQGLDFGHTGKILHRWAQPQSSNTFSFFFEREQKQSPTIVLVKK